LDQKVIPFPFFYLIYHQLLSKINHLAASTAVSETEGKELDDMAQKKSDAA